MALQQSSSKTISSNSSISGERVKRHYILLAFRWILTTSWFLFLLAAILVGTSLLVSFLTDAWHWFQRSGALMVSIGAILSTQYPLDLMFENMIGDTDLQGHTRTDGSKYLSDIGELRTCICGFIFVAMGTLIWAYGDLLGCLLQWDMSCLT